MSCLINLYSWSFISCFIQSNDQASFFSSIIPLGHLSFLCDVCPRHTINLSFSSLSYCLVWCVSSSHYHLIMSSLSFILLCDMFPHHTINLSCSTLIFFLLCYMCPHRTILSLSYLFFSSCVAYVLVTLSCHIPCIIPLCDVFPHHIYFFPPCDVCPLHTALSSYHPLFLIFLCDMCPHHTIILSYPSFMWCASSSFFYIMWWKMFTFIHRCFDYHLFYPNKHSI